MLLAVQEEQIAMETVLKGDVDQYVLDGTDRVLSIARCLQERIEQLPHQVTVGGLEVLSKADCLQEVLNFCVF